MEEAMATAVMGYLALARKDMALARQCLVESAASLDALGNRQQLPACLEGLMGVAVAEERWDLAARLCGMRERILNELGVSIAPLCPDVHDSAIAAARSALGDTRFETGLAKGRTASLQQAIMVAASAG